MISTISYGDLTDSARRRFDALKRVLTKLDSAVRAGGKVRPLCRSLSSEVNLSPERLRKRYEAWRITKSDQHLVDLRLCGGSATPQALPQSALPQAVVDLFHAQRQRMADKDPNRASWRWIITQLITGESLPGGVGTWQTLWMQLHPHAEVPSSCPWNFHNPPPGWSLSTFTRLPAPSAIADALATEGVGAAKALLAKHAAVRIDWTSLRPMELIWFDDHDVDFGVIVAGQVVRLRLILARDARTRRVLAYGVRPRLKEEDGTRRSITRRDMQHLIAGLLYTFGLPRDYPVKLCVENAAAAIATEFEPILSRVTQGRVTVDRTGLYRQVVRYGGHKEQGGSPTGKAAHESGFRLFDIELAHIRGQFGSNYTVKPGEVEGRLQDANNLLKSIDSEALINANGDGPRLPFCDLMEANQEIHLALKRMDARMWHEMEGFLSIPEFRFSTGDPVFRPLHPAHFEFLSSDLQADIRAFAEAPESMQNRWLAYGRTRRESSAEAWRRLASKIPFVGLNENALFELFLDLSKPVEYHGMNTLRLEIAGVSHEFRGFDHRLEAGQKITARFNADKPEMIWLQDHAGRCLGMMNRVDRLNYKDAQGRRDAMEFQAVQLAHATQEVRTLQMAHPDALRELRDSQGLQLLNSVGDGIPKPTEILPSPSSDELTHAAQKSPRKSKPKTDAESYLEMQKILSTATNP